MVGFNRSGCIKGYFLVKEIFLHVILSHILKVIDA